MGLHRIDNWGGERTGEVILANTPFRDRIGNCFVDKDIIQLPTGITLRGVRDTHVGDYLAVGTLAIAVEHTGDYFNNYIPVTVTGDEEEKVLTPYPDLEFGAYTFGQSLGRLKTQDLRKIAAGLAIEYTGSILGSIPVLSEVQ